MSRIYDATRQHGGMEFFLNPSDVLYVPPFWFHTVVSLSRMTVSYSVLSPSREEYHFGMHLRAGAVGVLSNDPPRILRIAVAAYINRILKIGEDSKEFMSLLEQRARLTPGKKMRVEDRLVSLEVALGENENRKTFESWSEERREERDDNFQRPLRA